MTSTFSFDWRSIHLTEWCGPGREGVYHTEVALEVQIGVRMCETAGHPRSHEDKPHDERMKSWEMSVRGFTSIKVRVGRIYARKTLRLVDLYQQEFQFIILQSAFTSMNISSHAFGIVSTCLNIPSRLPLLILTRPTYPPEPGRTPPGCDIHSALYIRIRGTWHTQIGGVRVWLACCVNVKRFTVWDLSIEHISKPFIGRSLKESNITCI